MRHTLVFSQYVMGGYGLIESISERSESWENPKMKHRRMPVMACLFLVPSGCGVPELALDIALRNVVTVNLVNKSPEFPVEATVFYDDKQLPFTLEQFGTKETRVIAPGSSIPLTVSCDKIESLVLDDADLLILAISAAETHTAVLYQGFGYECGDRIDFIFTHTATVTDFNVLTVVTPGGA